MKRRAFIKGLLGGAAGAAALPVVAALPVLPSLPVAPVLLRTGLNVPTWRKLHEGIMPHRAMVRALVRELNQTNEILDELPWVKGAP